MSDDEASNDPNESGAGGHRASTSDTMPGVPDIELGRTLPTGAALAAPWSAPERPMSSPTATPATSQPDARPSSPPSGTAGPLTFGTTRREFSEGEAPKLSAREKAKRNILTHTLQMPLIVSPPPPTAASASDAARRATLQGGSLPPGAPPSAALPPGWTSMHRVGSGAPPEPSSPSRPAAARRTEPMQFPRSEPSPAARNESADRDDRSEPRVRRDPSERFQRAERADPSEGFQQERSDPSERFQRAEPVTDPRSEPLRAHPTLQDAPNAWQQPSQLPRESSRWNDRDRSRPPEYERETLSEAMPVRVPALSAREWLFIALLACASAATLYSLLIDDVTAAVEEDADAATAAAPEHVVTPAPIPESEKADATKPTAAPAKPAAANANLTEIVSDPVQAEIVVGGAVIGNTPAQVVRGDKEADYLLRKAGYEPQLVRVTPHSPKTISITLHAKH